MSNGVDWQYYFARKFSLQRFEVVTRVFRSSYWWDEFGVRLDNMLVKPGEGKNHEMWLDTKEWSTAQQKVFATVYRDLSAWQRYKEDIKKTQTAWARAAEEIGRAAAGETDRARLAALYDKFIFHHQEHFNKPIWIPFATEPLLVAAAEAALAAVLERADRKEEYQKWFTVILSPEEQNAISRLEERLLGLALRVKKGEAAAAAEDSEIAAITTDFCFIPCYDVIDEPWNKEHFVAELKLLVEKDAATLEREYEETRAQCEHNHRAFQDFLPEFHLTNRERELFIMTHDLIFIKDERDDYRRLGSYHGRPLFAAIGRLFGLTTAETSYFSIEEMKRALRGEADIPGVAEIKSRAQGYLLLIKNGGPLLIASGNEMQRIIAAEIGRESLSVAASVRGVPASLGVAAGPVVIVRTKHDLRRVVDGVIMVAVTTNPDFVPAMKKCRAIVTNEGGVTAHAAIVSRELGLPCVVGVKTGTRVFRDGDVVEVNGDTGIVKRI